MAGLARVEKAALCCAAFFLSELTGCATPDSFGGSRNAVVAWANERGYVAQDEIGGDFRLLALTRIGTKSDELSVYIEGDGAAWPTRFHPPRDPTPIKPVALALSASDDAAAIAYIGRPCQYLDPAALISCDAAYWTTRRFAPEVLASYDVVLDRLKARSGSHRLRLYGYSGGGTIAALLAQKRSDVAGLVTIAAPLALTSWTIHHGVSVLTGSIDPIAAPGLPAHAVHWVGGRDKIVPGRIIETYAAAKPGKVIVEPDFDHECCWSRDWKRLLERSHMRGLDP